ncbi:MAG: hypothetical protein AB7S26_36865 [Sandaracinaceae bacterium]
MRFTERFARVETIHSLAVRAGAIVVLTLGGCDSDPSGDAGPRMDGGARVDGGGGGGDAGTDARAPLESCTNGELGETESDIDCGGGACPRCSDDSMCNADSDCVSLRCSGGHCLGLPSCTDGMQNGDETASDCGGTICPPCGTDETCDGAFDCETLLCRGDRCGAVDATCGDGTQNGSETGVDCGGSACGECREGDACGDNADCRSDMCRGGTCCGDTARLAWDAPEQNTDGSCLSDLSGFRAYWGTASMSYTDSVDIPLDDPGMRCAHLGTRGACYPAIRCSYALSGLPAGLVYFAVSAYNTTGVESMVSGEASKTIYPCP